MKKLMLIGSLLLSFFIQNASAECIYQGEFYGEDLYMWNDQLIISGLNNTLKRDLVVGQTYRIEMVYCSGGQTFNDYFNATYTCTINNEESDEEIGDIDYGTLASGYTGFFNIAENTPYDNDCIDDDDGFNDDIYHFRFETDNTTITHIWIYVYD